MQKKEQSQYGTKEENDQLIEAELERIDTAERLKNLKVKKNVEKLNVITASELQKLDIPPTKFIVDSVLPYGLTVLGAPSKYYKSWLAIDLCLCVASGRQFLGFKTNQCDCLYLDLESRTARAKSRINLILKGKDAPSNLFITTESEKLNGGLEEQLVDFIAAHPKTGLVVIDVLQKVRKPAKGSQTLYDKDYDDLGSLKGIADKHNIAILIIHHTRKMKDTTDVFNDLSGSMGIMGTTDAAWVISKEKRDSPTAKLSITGRDIESEDYVIQFDKQDLRWKKQGTAEDVEEETKRMQYNTNPIVKTVKNLLHHCNSKQECFNSNNEKNNGKWEGKVKDIVSASRYYEGCTLYGNAAQIGKEINALTKDFAEYDCIVHEVVSDGNAGAKHVFYYQFPF